MASCAPFPLARYRLCWFKAVLGKMEKSLDLQAEAAAASTMRHGPLVFHPLCTVGPARDACGSCVLGLLGTYSHLSLSVCPGSGSRGDFLLGVSGPELALALTICGDFCFPELDGWDWVDQQQMMSPGLTVL